MILPNFKSLIKIMKILNFHKFLSSFQNENEGFLDLTDQFKTNKSPMFLKKYGHPFT